MAETLLKELCTLGIQLKPEGQKLRYTAQKGVLTPALLGRIKICKKGLLDLIRALPIEVHSHINQVVQGDATEVLGQIPDDCIDQLVSDPPYGIKFMGKQWDKALPGPEVWKECLRVLKPGSFAFIMASPRQDVLSRMTSMLAEVGFDIGFSSIFWTYASGFRKAHDICKNLDQRKNEKKRSSGALYLTGSYAGFRPKPAVEVIIVAMKPLAEKTYTNQALANGKGITWLDDCAIPYDSKSPGRCSANLLVSDDVLDDGKVRKGGLFPRKRGKTEYFGLNELVSDRVGQTYDSGGYSRYFSLDAWAHLHLRELPEQVQDNFPFLIVSKAGRREKEAGLEEMPGKVINGRDPGQDLRNNAYKIRSTVRKNNHPTIKPIQLMAYLITMGSRVNDVVLDPFAGSGTTLIAARKLGRRFIGIEREAEYHEIAAKRLLHHTANMKKDQK